MELGPLKKGENRDAEYIIYIIFCLSTTLTTLLKSIDQLELVVVEKRGIFSLKEIFLFLDKLFSLKVVDEILKEIPERGDALQVGQALGQLLSVGETVFDFVDLTQRLRKKNQSKTGDASRRQQMQNVDRAFPASLSENIRTKKLVWTILGVYSDLLGRLVVESQKKIILYFCSLIIFYISHGLLSELAERQTDIFIKELIGWLAMMEYVSFSSGIGQIPALELEFQSGVKADVRTVLVNLRLLCRDQSGHYFRFSLNAKMANIYGFRLAYDQEVEILNQCIKKNKKTNTKNKDASDQCELFFYDNINNYHPPFSIIQTKEWISEKEKYERLHQETKGNSRLIDKLESKISRQEKENKHLKRYVSAEMRPKYNPIEKLN